MGTQQYRVDGKRVPSVTTVLGKFKDPGALMWWSWNTANSVLEEAVHLIESGINKSHPESVAFLRSDPLERANYRSQSGKAAEAGTIAHDLVEEWIHGEQVQRNNLRQKSVNSLAAEKRVQTSVASSAITSFRSFLNWSEVHRFDLVETEVPLLSDEYKFGGTVDCLAWLDDEFVIFDWKTSKGLYADYLLQLAAYGILVEENYIDEVQGFHLVRFDKTTADFHHHSWSSMEQEKKMFLLLRECYDLVKGVEKRCK